MPQRCVLPGPSISPELWSMILWHLSSKDLASFCRVSRGFRIEAERLLYREVHIAISMSSPLALHHFYRTIAARPSLLSRVESFSLSRVVPSSKSGQLHCSLTKAWDIWTSPILIDWPVISSMLDGMNNLRMLSLFEKGLADPRELVASVLHGGRFDLNSLTTDLSFSWALLDFLIAQPHLRHLEIASYVPKDAPVVPHPSALPGLTSLAVAGRLSSWMPFPLNVTHLRLDIDLPDNPFKAISQHRDKEVEVMRVCKIFGRQLVSFALYWYIAPPSRLQVPSIVFEILHRCPALRFLAVNDVSGVHPHLVKEYPEKKGPQPYLESTLLPPPASTTLNVLHLGRRPFSEAGPPYTPDAFAPFEVLLPDCVVYHWCRRIIAPIPGPVLCIARQTLYTLPFLGCLVINIDDVLYVFDRKGSYKSSLTPNGQDDAWRSI